MAWAILIGLVDTQLKQRLTGAAILVVVAVLLIPELLTGPKLSSDKPAEMSLPAAAAGDGAPLRSYDIHIGDSANPSSSVVREPPAEAPSVATQALQPPMARAVVPAPAKSPVVTANDTSAPSQKSGFAVQIGSFASRDSAERLAADLRRSRFSPYVSAVRTGARELYRVRVGPVADRLAADALAKQLAATGKTGSVVTEP